MFRAKITSKSNSTGRWRYAWKEVIAALATGADEFPLPFRDGSLTVNPLVEINDREVATDTIVWVRERGFVLSQMWFEFDARGDVSFTTTFSVTDNSIVRFDGTTGRLIQGNNNPWTISDAGIMRAGNSLTYTETAPGYFITGASWLSSSVATPSYVALLPGERPQITFSKDGNPVPAASIIFDAPFGSGPPPGNLSATVSNNSAFMVGGYNSVSANYNNVGFGVYRFEASTVVSYKGANDTQAGLIFKGGLYISGTFTGLTDPGDGIAGGTYP